MTVPVHAGDDHYGYLLIDPTGIDLAGLDDSARSLGNAMRSQHLIESLERQALTLQGANEELSRAANRDALTGLANRHRFERHLRECCERAGGGTGDAGDPAGEGARFALCFLDLDGFKLVNDTLGHEAGDALLRTVARRLEAAVESVVGTRGFIARLGGDEFTVIVRSDRLEDELGPLVDAVLAAVCEPFGIGGRSVSVSASAGGAIFPDHGADPGEILKRADSAMYVAKTRGKNGFVLYDPELAVDDHPRLLLAQEMREALADGGLRMHFQPRVDLATGRTCSAEALMRWMVEVDGVAVPRAGPDTFIPIAEQTGLIGRLGELGLDEACRLARRWRDAGTPLQVSVNVSVMQLRQDGFVGSVARTLARHGLEPSLLELEITESVAMHDVERSVEVLTRLRGLGLRLALDDFGTGHSSLAYLRRLPVDTLKIDGSFVRAACADTRPDGGPDPDGTTILRTIAALGKSMGFRLVAEGIETRRQCELARSIGCDEGQGYLFGAPVPAEDIVPGAGPALDVAA